MKLLLALFLLTLSCVYCQQLGPRGPWGEGKERDQNWPRGPRGEGNEKYTDRYDSMNIDQMLGNKRLVNAYVKCLNGSGKCTSDGRYLKSHVTDALKTGCKRCTDAQHKGVRKVVKYMIEEEPKVWEQLVKMYDPKGEYSTKYYDELNALQQAHVTDALKTGCKRCTDAQHKGVRKVVKYMIEEEPKVWEQLVKMYDPKGEYSTKYYDELNALQQGKKQ